jgi:hypothetical protein
MLIQKGGLKSYAVFRIRNCVPRRLKFDWAFAAPKALFIGTLGKNALLSTGGCATPSKAFHSMLSTHPERFLIGARSIEPALEAPPNHGRESRRRKH